MATTYRADHIGSLLRPAEVLQARAGNAQGRITLEQLREVEDKAILDALEMQRQAGIDILSDGEFRRSWFSGGIAEAVEGVIDDPDAAYTSRWQGENQQLADATAEGIGFGEQVVGAKLRQVRRLTAHESGFLKQHASGPFKITMPGAAQRAAGWYKPGLTDQFYASRAELVQDLVEILQREVKALLDEGVLYIQLDSLRYVTALANPRQRQQIIDSGEDPDKELDEIIAADNATFQNAKRPGVTLALHMCRGNNRSAWLTEGGYDAIAEKAFGSLQVDRFLLEYDTDRAGGFEPLRFVPRDKTVVLGLISSKEPTLESQDMLRRRIDEAARYLPLENLAISPQCGFASTAPGNMLTQDEQRRKLELVVEVARKTWG
ncbi:MAG: cobalamin-independent methionine synthase II family protein [Chloroflexi bacterium]|nr:cobalamin-independent methionine synthase II family protein [Chloroflexota bacterium]MCI0825440.1 cobalamin-independent methionine synthase II family protein [Chloroflexota bacterium]